MTVVTDKKGNMFNVELTLEVEKDHKELVMLGKALLEENNKLKSILGVQKALVKEDMYDIYVNDRHGHTTGHNAGLKVFFDTYKGLVMDVFPDPLTHEINDDYFILADNNWCVPSECFDFNWKE